MINRVGQQFGNYRLVRLLGHGGYAEVYLGEHQRLGTQAAVKVLYTHLLDHNADAFLREARTIANLEHPHIIRVFDFDVQEGIPFLVMSYAPNGTLRQRHPKGSQVPLNTIVDYVKQVADALQHAHDEKLIHRDIKPENILLGRHNEVLLSDFGIALLAQSSLFQSTQEVLGTAYYMAPEQLKGKPRLASDQYSLGVVVYEWICGERPFHGSLSELYSQHLFVPPPPVHKKVPTISFLIEEVVLTALAKDPKERFASVKAFATALEQACQVATTHPVALTSEAPSSNQPLLPTDTVVAIPATPLSQPTDVVTPSDQTFSPPYVTSPSGQIASQPPPSTSPQPDLQSALPLPPIEPAEISSSVDTRLHPPAPGLKEPASVPGPASKATVIKRLARSKSRLLLWLVFLIVIVASVEWNYLSLTRWSSATPGTPTTTTRPTTAATTRPTTAIATTTPPSITVTVNYAMFGFDVQHTHFNPYERKLTPTNVSHLVQDWTASTGYEIYSSPTVVDGVVYIGSTDFNLYAFNASTGKTLWTASTGGQIRSSPTVVNGIVYVGSCDSKLYAFDASTGKLLWTAATGGGIRSSPAVANGVIYIGSDDYKLYAFNISTGKTLWTAPTGNYIRSSPTVADGVVYVGSDDHNLYAFNASGCGNPSCSPLWTASVGNLIYSSPAVINGAVYVGSKDYKLYAFHLPGTTP